MKIKEEKKIKMSEVKVYLFHELSSYLPLLEGKEFDDLVEDIKEFGQIEPVTLYDGKILDGRNRYRACKILKRELIVREWKPSDATGSTPLQYVISENIMRRHLNMAQKAEIGMMLYDEIAKQVEEERAKKISETLKERHEKGELIGRKEKGGGSKVVVSIEEKIDTAKERESTTAYKVAQKVRVKPDTIVRVKKIKEFAKEDKSIAEQWEDAKKGESTIGAVYKKVQEKETIDKLPEDLKKEVKKEELTVKEAKDVAESFKEPEMRKEAIKTIKKEKKEHERTMDYIKKVGTGEAKLPKKVYMDINQRIVKQFQDTAKQIVLKMTMSNVKGYNEKTQPILIKIMKKCLEHLQNELNIKGEIISV